MISLALYQPDIPQNAGTLLRLGACLGVAVHIIEPAGFVWSDKALKRAGMDYLESANILRHRSFESFNAERHASDGSRLVLLTTRAETPYVDHRFRPDDVLLVGRESAGVPDEVHNAADVRLVIPMHPPARSLNVAVAASMVLGEALRQSGGFRTPSRYVS